MKRRLVMLRSTRARVRAWRIPPRKLLLAGSVAIGGRPRFSEAWLEAISLARARLGAPAIYSCPKHGRARPTTSLSRSAQTGDQGQPAVALTCRSMSTSAVQLLFGSLPVAETLTVMVFPP